MFHSLTLEPWWLSTAHLNNFFLLNFASVLFISFQSMKIFLAESLMSRIIFCLMFFSPTVEPWWLSTEHLNSYFLQIEWVWNVLFDFRRNSYSALLNVCLPEETFTCDDWLVSEHWWKLLIWFGVFFFVLSVSRFLSDLHMNYPIPEHRFTLLLVVSTF